MNYERTYLLYPISNAKYYYTTSIIFNTHHTNSHLTLDCSHANSVLKDAFNTIYMIFLGTTTTRAAPAHHYKQLAANCRLINFYLFTLRLFFLSLVLRCACMCYCANVCTHTLYKSFDIKITMKSNVKKTWYVHNDYHFRILLNTVTVSPRKKTYTNTLYTSTTTLKAEKKYR